MRRSRPSAVQSPPSRPLTRMAAFLFAVAIQSGPAMAEPPGPRDGVDYQLVLGKPPQGDVVEIRRRGDVYRHALVGETLGGVILYRASTGEAAVMEREAIYMMELTPSELGGFDAPAMMSGLVDGTPDWTTGGAREIAGETCNDYTGTGVRDGAPVEAEFCVTEDGIILSIRVAGAGQVGTLLEATKLRLGNQPLELFDFPVVPEDAIEQGESSPPAPAPVPAQ